MRIILLILFSFLISQITIDGIPKSFEKDLSDSFQIIKMPQIDIDAMMNEDDQAPLGTPFRYGKIFYVDYNLNNYGQWEMLGNGDRVWRLQINSNNAYAISLEYDYFHIPDGAEFYVYDIDKEYIFGAYSSLNNQKDYRFATPLVKGDNIILEYFEPHNVDFKGEIHISQIIHDYRDILGFFNDDDNQNRDCGTNVICPEADSYEHLINATSWLDMGAYICSGSMLNNERMDLEPYYMTAWHCTNGDNPSTFRFYFQYETSTCDGSWASSGPYAFGSELLSTSNGMDPDYSLLRITGNISDTWDVFYAGWDRSTDNPVISCGIHHPGGDPKKINFDDDIAYSSGWNDNQPTHWRVFWDSGGDEGGSSGCPVYDENFRFRGQLSGGPDVECEGNGAYSLFGKFDRAWPDINQWLDPDNTQVMYIDGTYDGTLLIEGCTDPDAENYNPDANVDDGSCFYGIADLFFGDTSSDYLPIIMNNSTEVSSFEFLITDSSGLIEITGVNGGAAAENGFSVSVSNTGLIIGFSQNGGSIPVGVDTLTNIEFTYTESGTAELCITDQVISDLNNNLLEIISNDCVSLELNNNLIGDINGDSNINIQDIVILINFILGTLDPSALEFYLADVNADGILNITDVILIRNIILP